jgi:threonylcarbamoyladenosine tRNA methylthiotransferase MtaB
MRMHVFPYSGRKGTKAYSYRDGVSNVVKKRREDKLLFLAKEFSSEFKEKFLDKEIDVLVEDKRTKDSYLQGYTDRYIKVLIDGPEKLKGKIIKLKNTVVEGPLKA